MCHISYKGYDYTGDYLVYPTSTMDYIIVKLDGYGDTCMVGRTLEDGESLASYFEMIAFVDNIHMITLRSNVSFEEAQEIVTSFVGANREYD